MRKSKSLEARSNLEETPSSTESAPKAAPAVWKERLKGIAVIVVIVILSVTIFIFRDQLRSLERFGYFGVFLISLLLNTTLVMPLPTGILTSAAATVYNPFLVGLFAGTGAALGEMSGYFLGRSGRGILNKEGSSKIEEQMRKYGDVGIVVLAFVPNPAFDLVGMVAGALKIPWYRFLWWCWVGKTLKMLVFSYTGSLFNF